MTLLHCDILIYIFTTNNIYLCMVLINTNFHNLKFNDKLIRKKYLINNTKLIKFKNEKYSVDINTNKKEGQYEKWYPASAGLSDEV